MAFQVYFAIIHGVNRALRDQTARRLATAALTKAVGQVGTWRLAKESTGKPFVLEGDVAASCHVSWSHSGAYLAAAATSAGPVGIDIETVRRDRNIAGIAECAFGPMELKRFRQEGEAGFYRVWTLREAIAKANGTGLAEVTDRHDRVADGPASGTWRVNDWHLLHQVILPHLHLAIAVRAPLKADAAWNRFTAGPDGDPAWTSSAPLPR